jgi:carbamoyltransferase
LFAQRLHDPAFKPHKITVPLWGPEFGEDEIRSALEDSSQCVYQKFESFDDLCRAIALRLAEGRIVAWFDGRMEFGPRALGSRSILADPRDPGMRDKINSLVKKREGFRPFAPIVTREAAAEYFDIKPGDEETFAHMLYVTQVRSAYRDQLPAITHVDGSARVQTVSQEYTPRLWKVLEAFEQVTGLPILLNTSFNVRGEPIVCTPQEAINTFRTARLDVLVMGDHLAVSKASGLALQDLPTESAGSAV